jgi:hypothetical protein
MGVVLVLFVLLRTRLMLKPIVGRRVFQASDRKSSNLFPQLFQLA